MDTKITIGARNEALPNKPLDSLPPRDDGLLDLFAQAGSRARGWVRAAAERRAQRLPQPPSAPRATLSFVRAWPLGADLNHAAANALALAQDPSAAPQVEATLRAGFHALVAAPGDAAGRLDAAQAQSIVGAFEALSSASREAVLEGGDWLARLCAGRPGLLTHMLRGTGVRAQALALSGVAQTRGLELLGEWVPLWEKTGLPPPEVIAERPSAQPPSDAEARARNVSSIATGLPALQRLCAQHGRPAPDLSPLSVALCAGLEGLQHAGLDVAPALQRDDMVQALFAAAGPRELTELCERVQPALQPPQRAWEVLPTVGRCISVAQLIALLQAKPAPMATLAQLFGHAAAANRADVMNYLRGRVGDAVAQAHRITVSARPST